MTLYKVIDTLKMLSTKHPNINSAYEGNIYDIMNANPSLKYACFVITQQSHVEDEMYDHYGFTLFYVDRLIDDIDSNRVQIQSNGKSMLSNIIKAFCDEFDAECERINFQTFTERFADECSGVYCTITIDMLKDIYCTEKYWDEDWNTPLISIRNQNKSVEFTENGTYTIEYDAENYTGLGRVSVEVNVPDLNGSFDDGFQEGYSQGKEDGYDEGKVDGYFEGKNDGLEEGVVTGKEQQKALIQPITITENGVYSSENGYSPVTVNLDIDSIYEEGKQDGIDEQKSKLESITITENGIYTKDDGYNNIVVEVPDLNGSYDEGYAEGVEEGTANAGAIIAETAQVLNITKNGLYSTKYSKDEDFGREVTGYFDDGTPFYDYAYLNDKVFKTDALLTRDSKIEVWWKPSNEWDNHYAGDGIVGTIEFVYPFGLRIKKGISFIGSAYEDGIEKEVELENKWYHLSFSYDEGLFVDGEFCGKQKDTIPSNAPTEAYCYINFIRDISYYTQANGYFGMVRIDDNIYIPTANGYINYVTKQPLEVYQDGNYDFEGIPESDGNLIRSVNVNIIPKMNIQKEGITFAYSKIVEVPEWADWSYIQDMTRMFSNCVNLKNIKLIDTSNVTNMSYMFYGCSKLESIPLLNTSKTTNISYMFTDCTLITTIPQLDTSNATNMSYLFRGCKALTSVPALNVGEVTVISQIMGTSDLPNLTDFGGLIGLKPSMNDNYGFVKTPNLSYQSCINILNGLYDFTGNGVTPLSSQGKLKVHKNFLNLVGDKISIATSKGWTITS